MEFVEVMKQKERMCRITAETVSDCDGCPLSRHNNGLNLFCQNLINKHPEEAEKIIMKWAEEHHIKTNKDKFNEVFSDFPVDIVKLTKQCKYNCSNYPSCGGCTYKEAIEFWDKEYKEVSKDADSN